MRFYVTYYPFGRRYSAVKIAWRVRPDTRSAIYYGPNGSPCTLLPNTNRIVGVL